MYFRPLSEEDVPILPAGEPSNDSTDGTRGGSGRRSVPSRRFSFPPMHLFARSGSSSPTESEHSGRPDLSPKPTLRRASKSSDLRQAYSSAPSSPTESRRSSSASIWTPELERAITLAMLEEMERREHARASVPLPATAQPPTEQPVTRTESITTRTLRLIQSVLDRFLRSSSDSDSPRPLPMQPSTSSHLAVLRVW